MVWNVRKCYITDRCTSASHGNSEVWLLTLCTERQGMKREAGWEITGIIGATKTRIPHIYSNLEVKIVNFLFSSYGMMASMLQKSAESEKHQRRQQSLFLNLDSSVWWFKGPHARNKWFDVKLLRLRGNSFSVLIIPAMQTYRADIYRGFLWFFLHNIKKPLLSSPLSIKPLAWLKIILFNIMVFRTNTSINHLFIFVMVCVKSNLCRTGAGRPRNPLQPWRRKKRNVTPRGQWPPLLGYRGSCTRAGPGSQVSRLAHSALPWRLPAQPSICKAVEGDPRGPLLASLAKHRS